MSRFREILSNAECLFSLTPSLAFPVKGLMSTSLFSTRLYCFFYNLRVFPHFFPYYFFFNSLIFIICISEHCFHLFLRFSLTFLILFLFYFSPLFFFIVLYLSNSSVSFPSLLLSRSTIFKKVILIVFFHSLSPFLYFPFIYPLLICISNNLYGICIKM